MRSLPKSEWWVFFPTWWIIVLNVTLIDKGVQVLLIPKSPTYRSWLRQSSVFTTVLARDINSHCLFFIIKSLSILCFGQLHDCSKIVLNKKAQPLYSTVVLFEPVSHVYKACRLYSIAAFISIGYNCQSRNIEKLQVKKLFGSENHLSSRSYLDYQKSTSSFGFFQLIISVRVVNGHQFCLGFAWKVTSPCLQWLNILQSCISYKKVLEQTKCLSISTSIFANVLNL